MKKTRRSFLRQSSLATLLLAGAASLPHPLTAGKGFARRGKARFRLSLAAYSFRKHFSWMKGRNQEPESPETDMFEFIDYCGEHRCEGAELTSYFFPAEADLDYFNRLKHHAYLQGVTISGTAIGNDFSLARGPALDRQIEAAKRGLEMAAMMGAPHVRFFAGNSEGLSQGPERLQNAIEALKTCCDDAAEKGVFIGVENHGGIHADQLLHIIEKVDSPWIGINLDTGNFFSDTPYDDLEQCAPYAVNVQVKVNMQTPDRTKYPADLERIAGILKRANYQGFVVLEYEEEDPYGEIPDWLHRLEAALNT